MERAIEIMAAIHCIAFGVSHMLQPTAWAHFFIWLRSKGHPGVFVNGLLTLAPGSLVVSFHNVWTGIPAALTVIGWAQVVKGLICLWVPLVGMWSLQNVSVERARMFIVPGAVLTGFGGLLVYSLLAG